VNSAGKPRPEAVGGGPGSRRRSTTDSPKRDPARCSFARPLVRPSLLRASLIASGAIVPADRREEITPVREAETSGPCLRLRGDENTAAVPEHIAWQRCKRPDFRQKQEGDER
jgi:hypothetical protein